MNGFFGAIVERILPSTPAVTPRRPARFESPAAELPPSVASNIETPASSVPETRPATIAAPTPVVAAARTPSLAQREDVAQDSGRGVRPPTPTTIADTVDRERHERTASVERRDPVPVTMNTPVSLTLQPVVDLPVVSPRSEDTRLERAMSLDRRADPEANAVPRELSPAPATPIVPVHAISPVIERPVPIASHDVERAAVQPPIEHAPHRAPRIEVTIGTVEVRAVATPAAAPPPPRPAREPAPPITLTDYLKQRANARP